MAEAALKEPRSETGERMTLAAFPRWNGGTGTRYEIARAMAPTAGTCS